MIRRFFQKEDSHEFKPLLSEIEEDPGNPLGRFTFWMVIVIFLFLIGWMCLGEIDVVISARGKIVPDGSIKVLQPLDTGVVSEILIKEGDYVTRGQPLITIDPSATDPALTSSKRNLSYLEMEQQRLSASAKGQRFQGATEAASDILETQEKLFESATQSLERQLAAKGKALQQFDHRLAARNAEQARHQQLLAMAQEKQRRYESVLDIIPRKEYEDIQTEVVSHEQRIREIDHEKQEIRAQEAQTVQEMALIQADFKKTVLTELAERQKQITQLTADIEQTAFRRKQQQIVSPVNGYVNELMVHTVGGVVTPAEKIISIVPDKTPLIVEAKVLNKDVGFVQLKDNVTIKVDTFDFQKYGTIEGTVKLISRDSVKDEQLGEIYRIYIKPEQKFLMVDGQKEYLKTGLSVNSEINVGRRKIIEFFIYPIIKHLDEGMSVR